MHHGDRGLDLEARAAAAAGARALVVGPYPNARAAQGDTNLRGPQARLEEAEGLARAIDLDIVATSLVLLAQVRPATYLGKGKVEEIASLVKENEAELVINLDVFEMLERLNHGYRPSLEEEQGYYLSLAVFKNVLGSAPYQEVLLTTTGHDFYRVERHGDGRLEMVHLPAVLLDAAAVAAREVR